MEHERRFFTLDALKIEQREDGKIITTYYYTPKDSPYRRVNATIWDPGTP